MRYLEIVSLEIINNAFGAIECADGSRIFGKLEAYSCKPTSSDRSFLKRLAQMEGESDDDAFDSASTSSINTLSSSSTNAGEKASKSVAKATQPRLASPPAASAEARSQRKIHAFLVGAMNAAYPDYDFSDVSADCFVRCPDIESVMCSVNTTLFNVGLSSNNSTKHAMFNNTLWTCIDQAIGVADCTAFTYQNTTAELDVFHEAGCIWSFNYLFYNRKLKRVLLFACKSVSFHASEEFRTLRSTSLASADGEGSGSSNPHSASPLEASSGPFDGNGCGDSCEILSPNAATQAYVFDENRRPRSVVHDYYVLNELNCE